MRCPHYFNFITTAISNLCMYVNFECSQIGIEMQSLDVTHIALVTVFFDRYSFDSYECNTQITIGLPIKHLAKVMSIRMSFDYMIMRIDTEATSLQICYGMEDGSKTFDFSLMLWAIQNEHMEVRQ